MVVLHGHRLFTLCLFILFVLFFFFFSYSYLLIFLSFNEAPLLHPSLFHSHGVQEGGGVLVARHLLHKERRVLCDINNATESILFQSPRIDTEIYTLLLNKYESNTLKFF